LRNPDDPDRIYPDHGFPAARPLRMEIFPAESVLFSWRFEPLPTGALLVAALLYWRGWKRLSTRLPGRFPVERLWAFLAGLAAVYLAIASPLDAFAGWLLTVHMVQHLLLTMVAPPLILLGNPLLPVLSGLPRGVAGTALGPFLTDPPLHRFGRFLVHPLFAGPLFLLSNVIWHTPDLYDLALRSPGWHLAEHACFLSTALLFWWPVIQPWPMRPAWPRWAMIPYLLAADLQNTALSAFLSFYEGVLYPTYAVAPRISNLTAADDQAAAGAVMWVPGSMVFLLPVAIIVIRYLSPQRKHRQPLREIAPKETTPRRPFDLLLAPVIGPILRWRPFRPTMQSLLFLTALAVVADGLFGPQVPVMNLGGVLPWTYWRGLTVVALLVAGNLFCMACPFMFSRDLGRRIFPASGRWPRLLRSKWPAVGLLAAFFWAYEFFHLWNSPWWTAWIVLAYFTGAVLVDGFFRGAGFCKYLCPIGQFHFVASLSSPLEVRVREPDVCSRCETHDCLRGNAFRRGCELRLFQPRKSGNMDCTFCLDCIKACPRDNVGIIAVPPGRDLLNDPRRSSVWQYARRPDLAALVLVFVFAAFANSGGMVVPVLRWEESLRDSLGTPAATVFTTVLFFGVVLLLPALLAAACAFLGTRLADISGRWREVACGFSVALAPLGFGMWLAHFVFHLLAGSHTAWPVFQRIAGDLGATKALPQWNVPSLAFAGLPGLQILLLNAGCLLSLWILWRKSKSLSSLRPGLLFLPWLLLAVALYTVGIWIIFQPMEMRGTLFR